MSQEWGRSAFTRTPGRDQRRHPHGPRPARCLLHRGAHPPRGSSQTLHLPQTPHVGVSMVVGAPPGILKQIFCNKWLILNPSLKYIELWRWCRLKKKKKEKSQGSGIEIAIVINIRCRLGLVTCACLGKGSQGPRMGEPAYPVLGNTAFF